MSLRGANRFVRSLPVMQCDAGCGECCGIVPVTAREYRRVLDYAEGHGVTPVRQGVTCPFYQRGQCSVYEVRPWICSLFGHIEVMRCSRGYNTNAVSLRKARRMTLQNGKPVRTLHDAVGGLEGIL